jgi:hypothetical protein
MGWVVNATTWPLYPKDAGWAPMSVLAGAKNHALSRIRFPDRSFPRRGDIFRTRPDRSWSPPILPYNGYRGPYMLTAHPHLALKLSKSRANSASLLCQSWHIMVRLLSLPYCMNVNKYDAVCILPSRLTTVASFKYLCKTFFCKAFRSSWHGNVWNSHPEFSWRKCGRRYIFRKV